MWWDRSKTQDWQQTNLVLDTSLGPLHRWVVYPCGIHPPLSFFHLRSKISPNAVIPRNHLQIPILSDLHFTHWEHCYFLLVSEMPHFTCLSSSLEPFKGFLWPLAYLILETEVPQCLVLILYCFPTYIFSLGALTQIHGSKYCLDACGWQIYLSSSDLFPEF